MDIAAGKLEAQRTWGDSPTGIGTAEGLTPGTPEHFERSLRWRSEVEQPWLREVAPFHEWAGKRVLEVGFGPGYDALQIIQAGADYSGVDITPENVERTRKALAHYGIKPDVQQGDAEALPFPDNSFDVVYSNGVLHHCPDTEKTFREAARVLKPGGRFYVILYHRDGVFYRLQVVLWRWLLLGGWLRRSLEKQRSRIEWSGVGGLPIVKLYSRQEVGRMLRRTGFAVTSVVVRKLVPEDFPACSILGPIYRLVPQKVYDQASKLFGWYVCAEAFKP